MKTRILSLALMASLVVAAASLTGCSTYRLGSMLPEGIDSVFIPTFINETDRPNIELDTTRATIRQLQQDGSLQVARNAEEADAILDVTLTDYSLTPLAYDSVRKTAANEYRMIISSRVVLTDAATGEVIAENPVVQGDATFDIAGDFTSSQIEALPIAANKLGQHIVDAVVEYW